MNRTAPFPRPSISVSRTILIPVRVLVSQGGIGNSCGAFLEPPQRTTLASDLASLPEHQTLQGCNGSRMGIGKTGKPCPARSQDRALEQRKTDRIEAAAPAKICLVDTDQAAGREPSA